MSIYEPFQRYLEALQSTEYEKPLTFKEIEDVLGFSLPHSAYIYRAWWSNPTSPKNHPHAQSWLKAGWKVVSVDLPKKKVHFLRSNSDTTNNAMPPTQNVKQANIPKKVSAKNEGTSIQIEYYQFLLDLGFEEVGIWSLEREKLQYHLNNNKNERNILYAFIEKKRVMYIGKTTRTLDQRMIGYCNPGPSQTTNIRNNKHIQDSLSEGKSVQIFALVPKEEILYKGFPMNVAAGLEDNLLKKITPVWNNRL